MKLEMDAFLPNANISFLRICSTYVKFRYNNFFRYNQISKQKLNLI